MSEERFSEEDLQPSAEEKQAARRAIVDRAAAAVAVLAVGLWLGGMVALGACAAPLVFGTARGAEVDEALRPLLLRWAGDAMGGAFARFDQLALGASLVLLAAEAARTWAGGAQGRRPVARARRMLAILLALGAAYTGFVLTPRIAALHRAGALRGEGAPGQELDRAHKQAELIGKIDLALGVALIGLHVFTVGARRPDEEEDDDYAAPLPPGPMTPGARR